MSFKCGTVGQCGSKPGWIDISVRVAFQLRCRMDDDAAWTNDRLSHARATVTRLDCGRFGAFGGLCGMLVGQQQSCFASTHASVI